jgi:hypothetical protein
VASLKRHRELKHREASNAKRPPDFLLPVVSRIWDAAPPGQAEDASHDPEMVYAVGMNWLLIMAALACNPGDRLLDLRDKIPRGLNSIDLVVTVEPFYARFYIYQPGFPDSIQHCCSNKPTSIIKVPVVDGRFCVRQSQPQMKWTVRALFRPDIQM